MDYNDVNLVNSVFVGRIDLKTCKRIVESPRTSSSVVVSPEVKKVGYVAK